MWGGVPLVERRGQVSIAPTAAEVRHFSSESVSFLIHFPAI